MVSMSKNMYEHRTAIHEAGHALIAVFEGLPFESVCLGRIADRNGSIENLRYKNDDDDIVRVLLGGIMAARLMRRSWGFKFLSTACDDMNRIANLWREREYPETIIRWSIDRTAGMLFKRWSSVEVVAQSLVRKGVLSFEDVKALVVQPSELPSAPPGRLGKEGWRPLFEQIELRFRYPELDNLLDSIQR